jgi:lipopolysaccharide transport system permease protein
VLTRASGSEWRLGKVAQVISGLCRHRNLVWELARREVTDLHAGQMGGNLWSIVHPLLLFTVYALLFTAVFKVRIGDGGPSEYLIYLFAGLAPWLMTQDVIIRAAQCMIANSSIVQKVTFPTEVLVGKTVLASLTVNSVLMVLVLGWTIVAHGTIPASFILIPLLGLLHLCLMLGIAFFLSVLTPYFKDVPEFIRVFTTINVYLIPVLYLPDMVPSSIRFGLYVNPFSHLIWCYQDVIYFEHIVHPISWALLIVSSGVALVVGTNVFSILKYHVPSVL